MRRRTDESGTSYKGFPGAGTLGVVVMPSNSKDQWDAGRCWVKFVWGIGTKCAMPTRIWRDSWAGVPTPTVTDTTLHHQAAGVRGGGAGGGGGSQRSSCRWECGLGGEGGKKQEEGTGGLLSFVSEQCALMVCIFCGTWEASHHRECTVGERKKRKTEEFNNCLEARNLWQFQTRRRKKTSLPIIPPWILSSPCVDAEGMQRKGLSEKKGWEKWWLMWASLQSKEWTRTPMREICPQPMYMLWLKKQNGSWPLFPFGRTSLREGSLALQDRSWQCGVAV